MRTNVTLRSVKAPEGLDNYGKEKYVVRYSMVRAFLNRMGRTKLGETATLLLRPDYEIGPRCQVVVDSGAEHEAFRVESVQENLDARGRVRARTCQLVKLELTDGV